MYWGRWYHRLRMRDSLRDTELLSRNRCYLTGITDDFNLQSRWHYRLRTFDSLRDADLQLENREHLTSLAGVSPALTAIPLYTESMVPPLDEGIIHSDAQVCGREVVGILLMLMISFDQKWVVHSVFSMSVWAGPKVATIAGFLPKMQYYDSLHVLLDQSNSCYHSRIIHPKLEHCGFHQSPHVWTWHTEAADTDTCTWRCTWESAREEDLS